MKKILLCLSVLCLVMFASAAFGQNILVNPGFEDGTGTPPPPWFTFGGGNPAGTSAIFAMEDGTINPDRVHSGTKSFSVSGNSTTPIADLNGPRQWSVPIDMSGKTKYRFKAWIKKTAALQAAIRWHALDKDGNIIDAESGYGPWDTSAPGAWKEITNGLNAIQFSYAVKSVSLTVYVQPYTTDKGSVYIDDCGIWGESGGTEFGKVQGTVTFNSAPVPGAVVGIKQSAGATADAMIYTTTDADGNYGPVYIPNGTVYVAAWKEGWAPGTDVTVTGSSGSLVIANPTLVSAVGKNLSLSTDDRATLATASNSGEPASNVIDNDLETMWRSTSLAGPTQYVYVDLDPNGGATFPVNGVTIYWHHTYATSYTVDYTIDEPHPLFGWTTIYSTTAGNGGYHADPDDPYIDVVRFNAPVDARAIRIRCTAFNAIGESFGYYGILEIQVHSATDYSGAVYGYIKDSVGNPIEGALVHLGPNTTNTASYRQKYTDSSGFYSFAWHPNTMEIITADAFGYAHHDQTISLTATAAPEVLDFVLPSKNETNFIPNGDFEEPSTLDPSQPEGWGLGEWDPMGEVIFTRSTDHNHTVGGQACAQLDMRYITDPEDDDKWAGIYSDMFPINGDGTCAYNVWMWRTGYGWETYRNTHTVYWIAADQTTIIGGTTYGYYGWGRWEPDWEWWRTDAQYRLKPPTNAAYMAIYHVGTLVSYGNGEPPIQAVDDVVVEEVLLVSPPSNSLLEVKSLQVGTPVNIVSKQLTKLDGGSVLENAAFAYIEEPDRATGIRIDTSGAVAGDLWVGPADIISVSGVVGVTPQGEKCIVANTVEWGADTRPIDALGMNNRAASMAMSQGLFVKLTGKVTDVQPDYFTISDGSVDSYGNLVQIKVYSGLLNKPSVGETVRVRGVVSTDGTNSILLMREDQVDWVSASSPIHPLPFQGPVKAMRDCLFLGLFGDDVTEQNIQMGTDFIAQETGGVLTESNIRPSLRQAIGEKAWFRHDGLDELMFLNRVFYPDNVLKRTAYAHVYVWSPYDQLVDILVGSDDGVRVWVNGSLVWAEDDVTREMTYGQGWAAGVMLNAGLNSVLFKVCNGTGNYLGLVAQFAVPGSWTGPGWGNSSYMEGLGYLLNQQ